MEDKMGKSKKPKMTPFEKKVHKFIKEAWEYFGKHTKVCPDAEDIWNHVITELENDVGSDLSREDQDAIWEIITGGALDE
jgi:hypothetical protein